MLDLDTFLTTLYVMVDDFCKENLGEVRQPGRPTALAPSEVITLALVEQFWQFRSEREFYRYAQHHLTRAFPTLPDRAQFNRAVRHGWKALVVVGQALVDHLQAQQVIYEVLDSVPVPVRNCKRRGRGWLGGWLILGGVRGWGGTTASGGLLRSMRWG